MLDFESPQSRAEAILQNALGAENEVVPQSRVEKLLQKLDEALEWNEQEGGTSRSNVDTILTDGTLTFRTRLV